MLVMVLHLRVLHLRILYLLMLLLHLWMLHLLMLLLHLLLLHLLFLHLLMLLMLLLHLVLWWPMLRGLLHVEAQTQVHGVQSHEGGHCHPLSYVLIVAVDEIRQVRLGLAGRRQIISAGLRAAIERRKDEVLVYIHHPLTILHPVIVM